MTPADLHKAKREAAERFYALGMASLPTGWTYEFRKALSGYCTITEKHISAPRPVTRKALYIWLHECAHAHLHVRPTAKKRHVEEMEAEQWAHDVMRAHGIPVPIAMTARARRYVAHKINQAEKRGAKWIDPNAVRFSKGARK